METNFEKEPKDKKEANKDRLQESIAEELYSEKREDLERKESLMEREKISREELKKELEEISLSPELEKEAKKEAEQIKTLEKKGKLKKLLDLAGEKGIEFAIGVAKDMKDPYTLDIFHDILARDEFYKKFEK